MKTVSEIFRLPFEVSEKLAVTSAKCGTTKTAIVIKSLKNFLGIESYEESKWIPTNIIFGCLEDVLIKTDFGRVTIAKMVKINNKHYWECHDKTVITTESVKYFQLLPK